jgi:DNA-binding transcriptional ArsR family regulator
MLVRTSADWYNHYITVQEYSQTKEPAMKPDQAQPLRRRPAGGLGDRRGMHSGVAAPLDAAQLQAVAGLFDVLSEHSRLRILQVLQHGPASVGELVDRSGFKQANVSKQLGVLLTAGIIARRQDGNRAIYSIAMPLVFDLCALVCRGVARQAAERAAMLGA